ncbi:MAG TPA: S1 RNA-binding domain-containing protein, partial [Thermodesulfobacteriota bacterium]|nr:S1 RNA-binding domain-containing protein [Thermodesulfobacteriota bacterium]
EDLQPGMKLDGIVTNVTAFGAFVDIGVHQDGLVHISQLSDRFVKDPHQVVKVQQKVKVTVLSVDLERKRISLSMKKEPGKPEREPKLEGKSSAGKPTAAGKKSEPEQFNNPFVKAFRKEK